MTGPEKEAYEILAAFIGAELAKDIIAHRRGMKVPLTGRGARSLVSEYQKTGNAVIAAEEQLNRGWRGFKASWLKQPANFNDPHNPSQRRPGDMGEYTRQLMEDYDGKSSMAVRNNEGAQYALDHTSIEGRRRH